MASEVLAVPEEHLAEVTTVLRAGLDVIAVTDDCAEALINWCDEIEEYLNRD